MYVRLEQPRILRQESYRDTHRREPGEGRSGSVRNSVEHWLTLCFCPRVCVCAEDYDHTGI